ncbi:hypothetical protein PAMA_009579 [Pampus argenteus]
MLKAEFDMVVQWVPLGFMSALYEELVVQPEALCWVLFFLKKTVRQIGRAVCGTLVVPYWLLWLTCLIPGRLHPSITLTVTDNHCQRSSLTVLMRFVALVFQLQERQAVCIHSELDHYEVSSVLKSHGNNMSRFG